MVKLGEIFFGINKLDLQKVPLHFPILIGRSMLTTKTYLRKKVLFEFKLNELHIYINCINTCLHIT